MKLTRYEPDTRDGWGVSETFPCCSPDPDGEYVLHDEAQAQIDTLRVALTGLLEIYTRLANSGDAGFWDCEKESEVKSARAALNSTDPTK